jgi:thiol:disulfide interchange protein DsbA
MKRNYFKALILVFISLHTTMAYAAEQYVEGKDYTLLANSVRSNPAVTELLAKDPQKAQVLFFFSYGCPACGRFDPYFEKWLAKQNMHKMAIYRFPAMFEESWDQLAKLYYVMLDLKPSKNLNAEIFTAIQQQGQNLKDESDMTDFFVQHGYKAQDVANAYNSYNLKVQVKYAAQIEQAYKINETPTIIVNGTTDSYVVTMEQAQGNDSKLLDTVEYLIKKG